jgi:hypothetical protein
MPLGWFPLPRYRAAMPDRLWIAAGRPDRLEPDGNNAGLAIAFATAATAALLSYGAVRLALTLPEADPRWAYGDGAVAAFALVQPSVMRRTPCTV